MQITVNVGEIKQALELYIQERTGNIFRVNDKDNVRPVGEFEVIDVDGQDIMHDIEDIRYTVEIGDYE